MSELLKDVASEIGNEYASLVSDGVSAGDTSGYIDTGSISLMLSALEALWGVPE